MAAPELLSILVPVFNESRTVASVIARLKTVDLPVPREIIVINDGSSDGTREVLDALPVEGDAVRILHVAQNAGKGAAIRLGLQHARGTIIAIQDADLELDPAQLAALVDAHRRRRDQRRLRFPLSRGPARRAVADGAREPHADRADQRAVRRAHHRHGDLLQDHADRRGSRPRTRIEPLRHRARNHRQAAPRRASHPGTSRRSSSRVSAPRARRSAGATVSTPCVCLSVIGSAAGVPLHPQRPDRVAAAPSPPHDRRLLVACLAVDDGPPWCSRPS